VVDIADMAETGLFVLAAQAPVLGPAIEAYCNEAFVSSGLSRPSEQLQSAPTSERLTADRKGMNVQRGQAVIAPYVGVVAGGAHRRDDTTGAAAHPQQTIRARLLDRVPRIRGWPLMDTPLAQPRPRLVEDLVDIR
jgi:hypothetical protein